MKSLLVFILALFSTKIFAQQKIDTVYTEKNGELETLYLTLIPEKPSKGL